MWVQFLRGGVIDTACLAVAEGAGVIRSDLAEPAYSTRCLSVHEVKLLYDALMNATDVWVDMNMICRYIDEVHAYTISCGLHNMSIYIRRYSFEVPLEPCAGRAAPPPTICGRRRRRGFLLTGAPPPPPPIICRRAADTVVAA